MTYNQQYPTLLLKTVLETHIGLDAILDFDLVAGYFVYDTPEIRTAV